MEYLDVDVVKSECSSGVRRDVESALGSTMHASLEPQNSYQMQKHYMHANAPLHSIDAGLACLVRCAFYKKHRKVARNTTYSTVSCKISV